jgi:hypothetical protein
MSTTASAVLLENASATGNAVYFPGGVATFTVIANFGAGNVTLEMLGPDGTTWIASVYPAITSNSVNRAFNFINYPPGQYRATVNGGATAVWARLDRVPY